MEFILRPTQEFVRERFYLDKKTWTLVWRINPRGQKLKGKPVGSVDKRGYIATHINDKKCYAHQLIWLYLYGEWPTEIDHIDGNKSNNNPSNLRKVRHAQNLANARRTAHGVEKHGRKYRARIITNGVRTTIGSFDTRKEAKAAYMAAHLRINGEFSVYSRRMET